MTEVHRYKVVKMLSEGGNRISYDPHGPEVVMAEAYDQLKAENEALRSLVLSALEEGKGAQVAAAMRLATATMCQVYGIAGTGIGLARHVAGAESGMPRRPWPRR